MNSVKIDRLELLKIVKQNHQKHILEYDEAVEDYKKLVLSVAQQNLKLAKSSDLEEFKKFKAMPSAPTSYSDSYIRSIRMLELSVENVIELDTRTFNQLVLDEWEWKRGFVASTAFYKTGDGL